MNTDNTEFAENFNCFNLHGLSVKEMKQLALKLRNLDMFHAITMFERGEYDFEKAARIIDAELSNVLNEQRKESKQAQSKNMGPFCKLSTIFELLSPVSLRLQAIVN